MLISTVPKTFDSLIHLGLQALAGAQSHGLSLGLQYNTAELISADLFDLTGDPATPLVPGKQAILNSRRQAAKAARTASLATVAAGREYCRMGISLLKPVLGKKHNSDWLAAGFLTPSLAMPDNPMSMLIQFRVYFEANAARENAPSGITAAQAQAKTLAIQAAQLALTGADGAELNAKGARDLAQRALQKRMIALRLELVQLLSREDPMWHDFGFRRPADGHIPNDVEGLQLLPGVPGSVTVRWKSSSNADNYRVTWRPAGAPIESTTEVGLFSDLQMLISGLASGTSIIVGVSARNSSGETQPTEATINVP